MRTSPFLQRLALTLLALSLQACFSPDSVVCASGLLCPPGHSCSADQNSCISNSCGNGIVEGNEVCDDGNVLDHDGCSADCSSNEKCGNGVVDLSMGEKCDDGNTVSGDKCSADCKSDESCGNGIVDQGEMCDTGALALAPTHQCSADCKSDLRCGNGVKDPGEVCDDGNNLNGDGCSADCQSKELCGNSVRDGTEECDEGPVDTETCINCHVPRCGDGLPQGKEQCDTGGESSSCNINCTRNQCGDGVVNKTAGEECDPGAMKDGHAIDTASCNHDCKLPRCGDGTWNQAAGEECDPGAMKDGHAIDTASCTQACKISSCGDGYTNKAANEQCDDGNSEACGTCSEDCTKPQTPGLVTGTITAAPGSEIKSGDWFSLGDGNVNLTFVFQKGTTAPTEPNVVSITGDMDDTKVAEAIRVAIKSVPVFFVAATVDGGSKIVKLKNTQAHQGSPIGVGRIVWYVNGVNSSDNNSGNSKFKSTDMANEADFCAIGVGCKTDADCESGYCRADGRCKRR